MTVIKKYKREKIKTILTPSCPICKAEPLDLEVEELRQENNRLWKELVKANKELKSIKDETKI